MRWSGGGGTLSLATDDTNTKSVSTETCETIERGIDATAKCQAVKWTGARRKWYAE